MRGRIKQAPIVKETFDGGISAPIAGPGPIGQLAEVAAGLYTEIVSITAPVEAEYSQTVNIIVGVKNTATYNFYITVTGAYVSVPISDFSPSYAFAEMGIIYQFTSSFTMPNKSITLYIFSWFLTGTDWTQDDYKYINIALKAVVIPSPEFSSFGITDYDKV